MKNNKEKIKKLFEENNRLTINDVTQKLNISRETATKWLEVLKAEGYILEERYGNVKVFWREKDEKLD